VQSIGSPDSAIGARKGCCGRVVGKQEAIQKRAARRFPQKLLATGKSLSLHYRIVIALHSPGGFVESTAGEPSREKEWKTCQHAPGIHSLRSLLMAGIAKSRLLLAVFGGMQRGFSAVQTAWRREVDSNPRSGFGALSIDVSVPCR
jgi:hypothetical protein